MQLSYNLGLSSLRRRAGGYVGPFDTLNIPRADAAIAYSLQRLWSAYTGPLVSVMRTTGSATADVFPDAATGYVSTASVVTQVGVPGNVLGTLASWAGSDNVDIVDDYEQSTNARTATQTVAANRKRLMTAGVLEVSPLSGRVGANCFWNSVRAWTDIPSFTSAVAAGNVLSQVVCAYMDSVSGNNGAPTVMGGGSDHWGFGTEFYRCLYGNTRPGMNPAVSVLSQRWSEYLERTATPTLASRYVGSTAGTFTFAPAIDAIANPAVGRRYGAGHASNIFGGWTHEFVQFGRALTTAERDAIQTSHGTRW